MCPFTLECFNGTQYSQPQEWRRVLAQWRAIKQGGEGDGFMPWIRNERPLLAAARRPGQLADLCEQLEFMYHDAAVFR